MTITRPILVSLLLITIFSTGCRQTTKAAKLGRIFIRSEPVAGADIYIDGATQTLKTNAAFTLPVGTHRIRLEKSDESDSDRPEIGEASVKVRDGKTTRLTINLNKMAIIPASSTTTLRPRSPAQKAIFDYYGTLERKDHQTAFSYFSRRGKWSEGSLSRFTRRWRQIASVKILDLKFDSSEPEKSLEVTRVKLETVSATSPKEPDARVEQFEVLITTLDELGGAGLPRIESIIVTTETATP